MAFHVGGEELEQHQQDSKLRSATKHARRGGNGEWNYHEYCLVCFVYCYLRYEIFQALS